MPTPRALVRSAVPRPKIEMPKGSRRCGNRHDRKWRHSFILLVILPVWQPQWMTGDPIIIVPEPGSTENASHDDWQPDTCRAVCNAQRDKCWNNKQQSLKRPRQNHSHRSDSKNPGVTPPLCADDANPCTNK